MGLCRHSDSSVDGADVLDYSQQPSCTVLNSLILKMDSLKFLNICETRPHVGVDGEKLTACTL